MIPLIPSNICRSYPLQILSTFHHFILSSLSFFICRDHLKTYAALQLPTPRERRVQLGVSHSSPSGERPRTYNCRSSIAYILWIKKLNLCHLNISQPRITRQECLPIKGHYKQMSQGNCLEFPGKHQSHSTQIQTVFILHWLICKCDFQLQHDHLLTSSLAETNLSIGNLTCTFIYKYQTS